MLAQIAVRTGWSYDMILDQTDIPTIQALYDEWRLHPPLAELFASFVGYKPPVRIDERPADPKKLPSKADVLGMFGGGMAVSSGIPRIPAYDEVAGG